MVVNFIVVVISVLNDSVPQAKKEREREEKKPCSQHNWPVFYINQNELHDGAAELRWSGALVLISFVKFNFLSECVKAGEAWLWWDVCSCAWQSKLARFKISRPRVSKSILLWVYFIFKYNFSAPELGRNLHSVAKVTINTPEYMGQKFITMKYSNSHQLLRASSLLSGIIYQHKI